MRFEHITYHTGKLYGEFFSFSHWTHRIHQSDWVSIRKRKTSNQNWIENSSTVRALPSVWLVSQGAMHCIGFGGWKNPVKTRCVCGIALLLCIVAKVWNSHPFSILHSICVKGRLNIQRKLDIFSHRCAVYLWWILGMEIFTHTLSFTHATYAPI